MRLVAITLEGYKRFETKTDIDVAGDVVALVGPNEAGKSSILDAMLSLNHTDPITPRERTREVEGTTYVTAGYVLDDADRATLADLRGGSDVRWWTLTKWSNSDGDDGRYFALHPPPMRDLGPRHELGQRLKQLADKETVTNRFHAAGGNEVVDVLAKALAVLSSNSDRLTTSDIEAVHRFAATMTAFPNVCSTPAAGSTDQHLSADFCALLPVLAEYDEELAPHTVAGRRLLERRPTALMFTAADRELLGAYDLQQVADDPPPALANLARLAGLNLQALYRAVVGGTSGPRETLIHRANERLKVVFDESWGQEPVAVHLALRGQALEILVTLPEGGFNEFQERSAGLQSFVALRAFLALQDTRVPPILLVDEAEMHLHYDAQADLVDLFTEQRLAAKVIYSTHSAGCLPRDLGNGIRVVSPVRGRERSTVRKSVWEARTAGFSPLIYGMGATTFAFLPARNVLMAEGITDAMLIPTLFREAGGLSTLPFQVAPGLSTVPPSQMLSLTAEGGSVVFVTDGDDAGRTFRNALIDAGVAATFVFGLDEAFGEDLHLEDLIDPVHYATAVNQVLRTFQAPAADLLPSDVPAALRVPSVKRWCEGQGLKVPDKIEVAQRLLDLKTNAMREGKELTLLSAARSERLGGLLRDITAQFPEAIRRTPGA